eukprot:TRINITY_DN20245_c0_g1_i1.p1 TRINITY_DN20245_c0_g1~~TRINITY_DN20245_c0_g1_i1.p1  ORF type:complete len:172 (+),score=31.45 TRINITY_DN20245_c0_g1_i1:62-577(+)
MAASTPPTARCLKRLQKEWLEISKSPPENILATPLTDNILEWHYVVLGPADTVYMGGIYHGKVIFKPDYPHSPPSLYMLTPSGRFEPGKKLCLSMSDYHPETWSPAWTISSILLGLLSFMLENEFTAGSIVTTDQEKKKLAEASSAFNAKDETFRALFPYLLLEEDEESSS